MAQENSLSSFANTLERLEATVTRLENSDTPLEQSLKDFEGGVQLIRQAQKALLEAEQQVNVLLSKDGDPVIKSSPDRESDREKGDR